MIENSRRRNQYAHIGNRTDSTSGTAAPVYYCADDLNRYAALDDEQGCPATPPPTEGFAHDDDGNLTLDGPSVYTWDAENRLIVVEPVSPSNDPPRNKKVKFVYDYMGRRVRKAVYVYNNGWPADNNPTEVQHFVYDGWNVVMVLNGNNVTQRKYTWGLDLSGTIHGAGGIGGLLAAVETKGTPGETDDEQYWFMYDANGNVGQVLDATNTNSITIAAHYEYDPYGNVINNLGSYTYATANPIRFSTKWFDAETGLGYWGYRYYSPRLGRWMSRDPIGERGGLNLLGFVRNRPLGHVDPDGRQTAQENHAIVLRMLIEEERAQMGSERRWGQSADGVSKRRWGQTFINH